MRARLLVAAPFEDRNGQLALFTNAQTGVRVSPPALVESEARCLLSRLSYAAEAGPVP